MHCVEERSVFTVAVPRKDIDVDPGAYVLVIAVTSVIPGIAVNVVIEDDVGNYVDSSLSAC